MADKRMFSTKVIGSDVFTSMPFSAQALYFQLCMSADDEGFLNNAKSVQRMLGASDADVEELLRQKFVIRFESGVMLIRHWKVNNYIAKDRFKESGFKSEKAMIQTDRDKAYVLNEEPCIQNVDGSYTERIQNVHKLYTERIQNVDELYTDGQDRAKNPTKNEAENCEDGCFSVYKPYTVCIQAVDNLYTQNSIDKNSIDYDDDNSHHNSYSVSINEEGNDRSSTYDHEGEDTEKGAVLELVAVDGELMEGKQKTVAGYCDECGVFLSPMHYDEIRDYYERGMTDEAMCYAVDKAIANGARSWGYVRAIIEGWCQKGLMTLGAAKAETAAFDARKRGGKGAAPAGKKYEGIDPEEFMSGRSVQNG